MSALVPTLEGGFDNPVLGSQYTFRRVMRAMSEPGRIETAPQNFVAPAPLGAAMAAIACALADADASLWFDDGLAAQAAAREWLGFHTGATAEPTPEAAAFALSLCADRLPELGEFAQGDQEYPDRSTTIILEVDSLTRGEPLTFAGPGIDGNATLNVAGLPDDFASQWRENRARFPRGVDLILTCGDDFLCLPRSARLTGRGDL